MEHMWQEVKDYFYYVYLVAAGYLTWNHKRIDKVINDASRLEQELDDLQDNLKHIRDGVDRLTFHLLQKKDK